MFSQNRSYNHYEHRIGGDEHIRDTAGSEISTSIFQSELLARSIRSINKMKVFLTLFGIALTLNLFSRVEADCVINGETVPTGKHVRNCIVYTCYQDGNISALACPLSQCLVQIGYQETDVTKPYPECCARPICAPDENSKGEA